MWNYVHYFLIKFKWKKIWFSEVISLIFSKPKKNTKINTNFLKRIKRNPNRADKTAPWILLQSSSNEAITRGQHVAPWTRPPAFKSESITGQTWDSGQINLSGLSLENKDHKSAYLLCLLVNDTPPALGNYSYRYYYWTQEIHTQHTRCCLTHDTLMLSRLDVLVYQQMRNPDSQGKPVAPDNHSQGPRTRVNQCSTSRTSTVLQELADWINAASLSSLSTHWVKQCHCLLHQRVALESRLPFLSREKCRTLGCSRFLLLRA